MENQKNEIEPKMLETLDLRENDLEETEQERYDFLFETAKAENPGVCTYIIHMAVLEQIAEEKNQLPTDEQIKEVAEKYQSKPGRDEVYENLISIRTYDE